METVLMLIGALLLVIGTGFFVAVEFSLMALNQGSVRTAVRNGDKAAVPVLKCLRSFSTQLSSCQLGITLTTLLTGFLAEPAISDVLGPLFGDLSFPEAISNALALILALGISTIVSMILGELIPKNLAIATPMKVAKLVARPQLVFTFIFKPAIKILNGFSNWVLSLFGVEPKEEISDARSSQELSYLIKHSAQDGTLDDSTASLLANSLELSGLKADDVMTPRTRMESMDINDSVEKLIELTKETGHSRFPVTDESVDDIKGVVHVKKAVGVPAEKRADLPVSAIMTDVIQVPETIPVNSLLIDLRDSNLQLAVVLDEHGGTAGIVTIEDVIEEVVGEVADEHDTNNDKVSYNEEEKTWSIPGSLRPDEINESIAELHIPEDDSYETLSGFFMSHLEKIPSLGDTVTVYGDHHGATEPEVQGTLCVVNMDGARVDRVHFILEDSHSEEIRDVHSVEKNQIRSSSDDDEHRAPKKGGRA